MSSHDGHMCCGLMEYYIFHPWSGVEGWVRAHREPWAPMVNRCHAHHGRGPEKGDLTDQKAVLRLRSDRALPTVCVLAPIPSIFRGGNPCGGCQETLTGSPAQCFETGLRVSGSPFTERR